MDRTTGFVETLLDLSVGNARGLLRQQTYNPIAASMIVCFLHVFEDAGLTRVSRTGWTTIEHPKLGCLQWQLEYTSLGDVRHLLLMVNGWLVIRSSDEPGQCDRIIWVSKDTSTFDQVEAVERLLGTL